MGQYIKGSAGGQRPTDAGRSAGPGFAQEDAIGLQDDGFTQPDDQIIVEKPEVDLSVDRSAQCDLLARPANNTWRSILPSIMRHQWA